MTGDPDPKPVPPANDDDEATSARQRDVSQFAPSGQLVFPGAPAQLGLDGLAYEPPREASPHLGPSHEVLHGDPESEAGSRSRRRRAENRARWETEYAHARTLQRERVQRREETSALNNREALQYWNRDESETYEARDLNSVAESAEWHLEALSSTSTRFPGNTKQLVFHFDDEVLKSTPQLSMYAQLDVRHALLANGEFDRDTKCQRVRFREDADVEIKRASSGKWTPSGIIACGGFTCPCCGRRRSREVSSKLACAMREWLTPDEPQHDVWMLTLSLPHTAGDDPAIVVERLYRAAESFFRSRAWRRFVQRFGLVGKVRVLDATHGGRNGSHPHFHVALFVDNARMPSGWIAPAPKPAFGNRAHVRADDEGFDAFLNAFMREAWTPARPLRGDALIDAVIGAPMRLIDREVAAAWLHQLARDQLGDGRPVGLVDAWHVACVDAGVVVEAPTKFREHAVDLAPSERAGAYFLKWGLADEVGAPTAKHRSHLRLLDLVAAGFDRAGDMFIAWRRATHGKAWVTGLADVCNRLGVTDEMAAGYVDELRQLRNAQLEAAGTPVVEVSELSLVVKSYVYPAVLRLGWERVFAFVDGIANETQLDPQQQLDAFLWRHLSDREIREQCRNIIRRSDTASATDSTTAPPAQPP